MKTAPNHPRLPWRGRAFRLAAGGVALCLAACSTVNVKTKPQTVTREGLRSAKLLSTVAQAPFQVMARVGQDCSGLLEEAKGLESKGLTVDAAGYYLRAATEAYLQLANHREIPGSEAEKTLVRLHNAALARFAETWATDPRRTGTSGPFRFDTGGEVIEISLAGTSAYGPGYFDRVIAADGVEEKGVPRRTREGFGAPLVGIREQRPERAEELKFYPLRGLHVSTTATIDSVTRSADGVIRVTGSLRNPAVEESMRVGGRTVPVAANFSAPIAVILAGRNEAMWGLEGFFKADERAKQSGLFLIEPYDPKRIPVILIHGLVSVPIIWREIVPDLMAEEDLSRRYQFMVFTYPSSYPIIQSAHLLREQLAAARAHFDPDGNDPLSTNLVVAGHSMGGILTHTLVAEIGDNLWKQLSDLPFDQVKLPPDKKELVRQLAFFDPDPAVRRAIFISAPHRGAKMAEKDLPGMISRMARLPGDVLRTTADLVDPLIADEMGLKIDLKRGKTTAVQSLEPGAPMVAALDASPYKRGVIYHSIIGDRGKGDTPNSSDGIVEYWSSHQEGAASELIVPTDHSSYKSPLAIEEIRRILREHAGIR